MKKIIICLALLFSTSLSWADWAGHWAARQGAIATHLIIAGNESTMLIGDSITEGYWWQSVGACRSVNAGMGGIGVMHMAQQMRGLNGIPRYAFVMIGTNTANVGVGQDQKLSFTANYQVIIENLINRGTRPILLTIPPIERGRDMSANFSHSDINSFNSQIIAMSNMYNVSYVNLNYLFMDLVAGPNYGFALPGATQDGVHFSSASYVSFYHALDAALQQEILRIGKPCAN